MKENHDLRVKIIFRGDQGVGKTMLINRAAQDRFEIESSSIGIDFKTKYYDINGYRVKAFFWDTVGGQRFKSLANPIYNNSHAVCICFDLSNKRSFENLTNWKEEYDRNVKKEGVKLFFVGCKSDLKQDIQHSQIEAFAKSKGAQYIETSAKTNVGVNQGIYSIVRQIALQQVEHHRIESNKTQRINLSHNREDETKNYC